MSVLPYATLGPTLSYACATSVPLLCLWSLSLSYPRLIRQGALHVTLGAPCLASGSMPPSDSPPRGNPQSNAA